MTLVRTAVGAVLALFASLAFAQASAIRVESPFARATAPGAAVGGGYATIVNGGAVADRLLGAASPAAARVELHEMTMEGSVMKMREVRAIDVPAGARVELRPGRHHLMFIELKQPLKQGERVPVTLRFEKAGELKVELEVQGMAAGAPKHHGDMKH